MTDEAKKPQFGDIVPGAWPTLATLEADPSLKVGKRKFRVTGTVTILTTAEVSETIEIDIADNLGDEELIELAIEQSDIEAEVESYDVWNFDIQEIE